MRNIFSQILLLLFSSQFGNCANLPRKYDIYHYNITGHLQCVHREGEPSKAPVVGSAVELYDYNGFPVSHDLLGTAYTDKDGNFVLIGQEEGDWGPPEPYLYARCGDEWFYCCVFTDRVEQSVIMENGWCGIVGEKGNAMISRDTLTMLYRRIYFDCKKGKYWPEIDGQWGLN